MATAEDGRIQDRAPERVEHNCSTLSRASAIRAWCLRVVHSKVFDTVFLGIIFCNCIVLSLSSNREGFDATRLGEVLGRLDYVFVALYTVEVVIKVIATGFVLGEDSYLRDGWNCLDFFIVVMAYVSLVVPSNFTALRAIRALRPLRTVNRVRGMKVLVTTLISSLPLLLDVLVLCAFAFFLFGIIAVQLFAGVLRNRCGTPEFSEAVNGTADVGQVPLLGVSYAVPEDQAEDMCSGSLSSEAAWYMINGTPTAHAGDAYGGRACPDGMYCTAYGNPEHGKLSYDNMLWAWLTIFQHITLSDWPNVMYGVMDAVSYWVWIFYVVLIAFCAFFMVNLTPAVLSVNLSADNLKAAKEELAAAEKSRKLSAAGGRGGSTSTPKPERPRLLKALKARMLRDAAREIEDEPPPGMGAVRSAAWRVATSRELEAVTACLIAVNTVVMCINWFGIPRRIEHATELANDALTLCFLIELLIKLTAFGFARYFRDGMNVFDCLVVLVSVTEFLLDVIPTVSGVGPLSVLRAFRLLRVFRLARSWRALNSVILGMLRSLRASFMLVLLLVLFLFAAALVGMQLFGYKFVFCDYVAGASPVCPLGLRVWGDCPDHFYCYLPCDPDQLGSWVDAPGSLFNGLAYCERFCAGPDAAQAVEANATAAAVAAAGGCEYLAMVGKSDVPRARFDNLFWALCTVFQVLTGENWNEVMFDAMRTVSDWAALYFVIAIVIGNYLALNLFIAILVDNLDARICETFAQEAFPFSFRYSASKRGLPDSSGGRSPRRMSSRAVIRDLADGSKRGGVGDNNCALPPNERIRGGEGRPLAEAAVMLMLSPSESPTSELPPAKDPQPPLPEAPAPRLGDALALPLPPRSPCPPALDQSLPDQEYQHQRTGALLFELLHRGSSDGDISGGSEHGGARNAARLPRSASERRPSGPGAPPSPSPRAATAIPYPPGPLPRAPSLRRAPSGAALSRLHTMQLPDAVDPATPLWKDKVEGRALLLLGPDSTLRGWAAQLVHDRLFEAAFMLLIIASCVCLVLDSPGLDPDSRLAAALHIMDIIFVAAFGLEAMLKIVAFGLAFTGPHAYLRNGWNVLDGFIVLSSGAVLLLDLLGLDSKNLMTLRVLRALRALRPLRAVRQFRGLRMVVNALIAVLPSVAHVALVCLLFYLIFAILAVNLFKGQLYACVDSASGERLDPFYVLPPGQTLTRAWCQQGSVQVNESAYYSSRNVSMPAYTIDTEWINPVANFDNVGAAMLTLFQVSTISLWTDIAYDAVDATGVDTQPVRDHRPAVLVIFIVFIVICTFFMLNLFVGVTLDKFMELRAEQDKCGTLLTQEQQDWVDCQLMLLRTKMALKPIRPTDKWRRVCYDIVTDKRFEWSIVAMVVCNVAFMAMVHVDMSSAWQDVMSFSNLAFTTVFTLEAGVKLAAFGPRAYLRDRWNVLDGLVVLVSVASVALDFCDTRSLSFMPVLRVLRVVRVLRLVRNATGVRRLLQTLVASLPALANVGSVLLLMFFIYAVIGVDLFAGVKQGGSLDRHANFDNFANAMLLLFRMLTGESWDGIMQDCMATRACVLVSSDATSAAFNTTLLAGTYLDPGDPLLDGLPGDATDNQCPLSPWAAVVYFPTFVVFCSLILLQLIIAVLLDNLTQADEAASLPVTPAAAESFAEAWADADGGGSGFIHASQLVSVVMATEPPLGTSGLRNPRGEALQLLFKLDIPLYTGNRVSFIEVLHALTGSVCGAPLPDVAEDSVYRRICKRLPTAKPISRFNAEHFLAAEAVCAAVRATLLRYRMRDQLARQGQEGGEPLLPRSRAPRRGFLESLVFGGGDDSCEEDGAGPHSGGANLVHAQSGLMVNGHRLCDVRRQLAAGKGRFSMPARRPPLRPESGEDLQRSLSVSSAASFCREESPSRAVPGARALRAPLHLPQAALQRQRSLLTRLRPLTKLPSRLGPGVRAGPETTQGALPQSYAQSVVAVVGGGVAVSQASSTVSSSGSPCVSEQGGFRDEPDAANGICRDQDVYLGGEDLGLNGAASRS